jgi:rhodanese-related sulfurtransferase
MAKTKKQTAAKRSSARKPASPKANSNIVSFFQTKLEAEWGPYDLKRAADANPQSVVILDTRKPDAFAEEHIEGAINIPGEELESRLSELPKNKAIVPYCWSITCHLATRAALLLAQKGYKVHELAGGIETWKKNGFTVTTAAKQPALN